MAQQLADERRRAEEARLAAERRRQEKKEAKAREARLEALERRGEAAWREVETLIEARAMKSYANAAALLVDLRELSLRHDTDDEFHRRIADIRTRAQGKAPSDRAARGRRCRLTRLPATEGRMRSTSWRRWSPTH